jgi:hypothetical protein
VIRIRTNPRKQDLVKDCCHAVGGSRDTVEKYEAQVRELQHLVRFYEKRLNNANSSAGGATGAAVGPADMHAAFYRADSSSTAGALSPRSQTPEHPGAAGAAKGGLGMTWVLEEVQEGGVCYLWDKASGKLYSDPASGDWPKPVGKYWGLDKTPSTERGKVKKVPEYLQSRRVPSSSTQGVAAHLCITYVNTSYVKMHTCGMFCHC